MKTEGGLTEEQLRAFTKLTRSDGFRTFSLRLQAAKNIAGIEGGNAEDFMDDPRVTEIKVSGNEITYGFSTLLAKVTGNFQQK